MSEVQFNNFAVCDTCGVETLCRKTEGDDDECGACYWAPITHAKHEAELAALREELATLQTKHERTESALNGSMKALTRVDNMWKKRWLDKTGEPAMSLVVDDEFKALFEEIKDYRKRLTAAEHRNANGIAKLELAVLMVEDDERGRNFAEACQVVIAALNHTESGASE